MFKQGDRFVVTIDAVATKKNGKKLYLLEDLDIIADEDTLSKLPRYEEKESEETVSEKVGQKITVFRHKPVTINKKDIEEGDQIVICLNNGKEYTATAIRGEEGEMLFMFDECVCRRPMNSNGGSDRGYLGSELREYLVSDFFYQLPEWLQEILVPNSDGDLIYLLDLAMVGGLDSEFNETEGQIPYFESEKNRVAEFGGETADWWLRDVVSAAGFAGVSYYGNCTNGDASYSDGVRPAFAISLS